MKKKSALQSVFLSVAMALSSAAVVGLPGAAQACWDGLRAGNGAGILVMFPYGGGQADHMEPNTPVWSVDMAREYAALMPRLQVLAGEGAWIQVAPWEIEVCADDSARRCVRDSAPGWSTPDEILVAVGRLVGASAAEVDEARALPVEVWTLEVGRFAQPEEAAALAERINRLDAPPLHGDVEIGAFPAVNPVAHLLLGEERGGEVRVVVGAYASPEDVQAAQAYLSATLGVRGVQRPL